MGRQRRPLRGKKQKHTFFVFCEGKTKEQYVQSEVDDGVLIVRLNRAEKKNAFPGLIDWCSERINISVTEH